MNTATLLAVCSCPDTGVADKLANRLVEQELAACVSVLPGVRSTYRWQGTVTTDAEVLLYIKTVPDRWKELQACITAEHPYELPELIGIPITAGLPGYLNWIRESTC